MTTPEQPGPQPSGAGFEQDQITAIYNRNAPFFETVDAPMEWLAFKRWRAEVFTDLRGKVLEVGVGTGRNFPHYPQSDAVQMTAIDVAEKMLARAEVRKKAQSLEVDLRIADVQDLPFATNSFDVAIATTVFCSVADPVGGLRELYRVLKPGGELRLLEHQRPDQPAVAKLFDVLNPLAVHLSGANINRQTETNVIKAGFSDATSEPLSAFGIVRIIRGIKPRDPLVA